MRHWKRVIISDWPHEAHEGRGHSDIMFCADVSRDGPRGFRPAGRSHARQEWNASGLAPANVFLSAAHARGRAEDTSLADPYWPHVTRERREHGGAAAVWEIVPNGHDCPRGKGSGAPRQRVAPAGLCRSPVRVCFGRGTLPELAVRAGVGEVRPTEESRRGDADSSVSRWPGTRVDDRATAAAQLARDAEAASRRRLVVPEAVVVRSFDDPPSARRHAEGSRGGGIEGCIGRGGGRRGERNCAG